MTSRQRVLAALAFERPDRTPFAWGFGPQPPAQRALENFCAARGLSWPELRARTSDTLVLDAEYIGPPPAVGQSPYTSIWGIRTRDVSYGEGSYQEFVGHPLAGLEDPAQLDRIAWPNPDWFDYASLPRRLNQLNPQRGKATQISIASGGNPLEIYTWMTGMEETMLNLLERPALVRAALARICGCFQQKLQRCAKALGDQADLVHMADDLGGQNGLLFSRETYRQVVQPFHRLLIENCRRVFPSAKVLYHSDGAVFDVLPDLLDAGIDILEAVQTDATGMAPERLKSAFGKRLCFHGGISVQSLLPNSDAATVRSECARLAAVFGDNGGYIAAPSHAIQAGTPAENVWAMLEALEVL
ncbi:MAG TPA: uroporphyrinogen decarboxylase family protein [Planctomycetota bacterium]|jgi:uroporphyrinogen decarboxylase